MTEYQLTVSTPPHIKTTGNVATAMRDVTIALFPALLAAIYFFGLNALFVTGVCILSTMGTEYFIRAVLGRPFSLNDWSAVVTGLLLALSLPPTTPWWLAALGGIVAIAVAKELFGGLGKNVFNPALFARTFVFVFTVWHPLVESYIVPLWWKSHSFSKILTARFFENGVIITDFSGKAIDGITAATPLAIARAGSPVFSTLSGYGSLLVGNIGGVIGGSSLALLLGAAYLMYKGHIDLKIPGSILITTAILSIAFGKDPIFQILAGGLILGAFFMATDWVTSPVTLYGKIIYGVGIGIFTFFVRNYGTRVEGMCTAILHMNVVALFIDRYTQPRRFGG
ncbi:MAG: RnfABCDGE type electron transport complex subunit D [bacterium]